MGRPEKLNKNQQAEAIAMLAQFDRKDVIYRYEISDLTLRRYEKMAKQNAEAIAGQKAEQQMRAQEIAAEMNPPEAA